VGLSGRWVGREVGRQRGVWSRARSFRRDPAVGFILPARSFPKSPKGKKKKKKKKTYHGSRRPTVGETQRRVSVAGVCTVSSFFLLPSSFSSFLFFLFSLFSFVCTSVCVSCSHVVGSIIFVCIFFSLCEVAACEWWAKKPTFLPHPN
jgi:hypothetical protein